MWHIFCRILIFGQMGLEKVIHHTWGILPDFYGVSLERCEFSDVLRIYAFFGAV